MDKTDALLAVWQRRLLFHDGLGYTEIRDIKNGRSTFVETEQEFVNAINPLLKSDIYIGINPRKEKRGTSEDVSHITTVVFDIDPSPKSLSLDRNISWGNTYRVARNIGKDIEKSGGQVIFVHSGSGTHVYFPISPVKIEDLPTQSGIIKKFGEDYIAGKEDETVRIDKIFDLPRIIRVWGSRNTKTGLICKPQKEFRDGKIARWAPIWKPGVEKVLEGVPVEGKPNIGKDLIPSGSRNSYLTSLAGTMRRRGFSYEALLSALEAENSSKCNPPLTKPEIAQIAKSVARYNPENPYQVPSNVITLNQSYFDSLKNRVPGIKTGFKSLDGLISGLKKQKLYILAARPTEGKTSLTTQILLNIAEQGKSCLFFPTEVGSEPIYDKIISQKTGVHLTKFQDGNFSPGDMELIESVKEPISKLPITIVEDFGLDADKIEEKVKELHPEVLAVDYIQAFKFKMGDAQEIASAVRKLKEIASTYDIPVILASQLRRGDEKLDLSQLKGSGALEELADVVCFLFSPNMFVYPRPVELVVMKSKYSATGKISLNFYTGVGKFEEVIV